MKIRCLLLFSLFLFLSAPVAAKPLTKANIRQAMFQLAQSDPKGLEFVLENIDSSPSVLMLTASDFASRSGKLEDAGFLFYGALLRYKFDLSAFPAKEDTSAMIVDTANDLGSRLSPQLLSDAKLYAAVLERLETWSVFPAIGYEPGWPHHEAISVGAMKSLAKEVKDELLGTPRNIAKLLRNPAYMEKLRIVLGTETDDGRNESAYETRQHQAENDLYDIERKLGIEGMFYKAAEEKQEK